MYTSFFNLSRINYWQPHAFVQQLNEFARPFIEQ
jgi:hypothetical protein